MRNVMYAVDLCTGDHTYRLAKLPLRPHALLYEQFGIRRQRARQIVKALEPQRRITRANPESHQ